MAAAASKSNHEKTHKLLEQGLKRPQPDKSSRPAAIASNSLSAQQNPTIAALSIEHAPLNCAQKTIFSPHSERWHTGRLDGRTSDSVSAYFVDASLERTLGRGRIELTPSVVAVNIERRVLGMREFETFTQRNTQRQRRAVRPKRPAFLALRTPTIQQLQDGLAYVFHPLSDVIGENVASRSAAQTNEVLQWIEGFRQSVESTAWNFDQSKGLIDLMVALNGAVEKSDPRTRASFYTGADQVGLMEVLAQAQSSSKSVRIMKEIEEFQEVKEEWLDQQN